MKPLLNDMSRSSGQPALRPCVGLRPRPGTGYFNACHSVMRFSWLILATTGPIIADETATPDRLSQLDPLFVSGSKQPPSQVLSLTPDEIATTNGSYQELLALIPAAYSGNSADNLFSLRGMAQDNTVSYLGTGSNPLIQVFEDGIPLSVTTLRYQPPIAWDLGAFAVHYGPQFLGDGPVGLGGKLLLDHKDPEFSNDGHSMIEVDQSGTLRTGIAQNLVLIPNELAIRLSYVHQQSEGDAENLYLRDDSFGAINRDRLQGNLIWHPGKDPDDVISLSLIHDRSGGNPFARVQELPGRDLYDRKTNLTFSPSYPAERWAAALKTQFSLQRDMVFKSTTGIQHLGVDLNWDPDYTPRFKWFTNGRSEERRFTQDVSISANRDKFQWLVGAYLEDSRYNVRFQGSGYFPSVAGVRFRNGAEEHASVAAVRAVGDWEFAEGFHLNGGLRLNHEESDLNVRSKAGRFPEVRSSDGETSFNLLPELGIAWNDEAGRKNLGMRLSHGVRAGGVGYASSLGLTQPYNAESNTEIEVLSRLRLDSDVDLSASLFHSWIENQQVPLNVPGGLPDIDTLVVNAASSRRYGASMESRWLVDDQFTLRGALGWTLAEFRRFNDGGIDRSGQAFPNIPEWTASIMADYQHPSGWFGNIAFIVADTSYSDLRNPETTSLESRQLLSTRIGYAWESCRLYLFGSNLLDDEFALQRSVNSISNGPRSGIAARPRMLGIGAELSW